MPVSYLVMPRNLSCQHYETALRKLTKMPLCAVKILMHYINQGSVPPLYLKHLAASDLHQSTIGSWG